MLKPAPAGTELREGADAVRVGFFFGAAFVAVVAEVAVLVEGCGLFREGVREMGRGGLKAGRGRVVLGGMLGLEVEVKKTGK